MAERKYKSISVNEEDFDRYEDLRKQLETEWSAQIGKTIKVSLAETIKTGMAFYSQRRKMEKPE